MGLGTIGVLGGSCEEPCAAIDCPEVLNCEEFLNCLGAYEDPPASGNWFIDYDLEVQGQGIGDGTEPGICETGNCAEANNVTTIPGPIPVDDPSTSLCNFTEDQRLFPGTAVDICVTDTSSLYWMVNYGEGGVLAILYVFVPFTGSFTAGQWSYTGADTGSKLCAGEWVDLEWLTYTPFLDFCGDEGTTARVRLVPM